MNRIFLLAVFLLGFAPEAAASARAEAPRYRKQLPRHVCVTATRLDRSTRGCEDNSVFLRNAEQCLASVRRVADEVARELKKQGVPEAGDAQDESLRNAQAHLAEAIAAKTYALEYTEQALEDLDGYFDYVVRPDDVERDEEILRTACYRDAVVPIDRIAENLERRIAEAKKDLSALEEKFAVASDRAFELRNSQGGENTLPAPVKGGQGNGGPAGSVPAPKAAGSTITGIEEDAKKRD